MSPKLSYCGLSCETCPIYVAARESDRDKQTKMRSEIADMCTKHYGVSYQANDINDCDGCRAGARLFFGCDDCHIRNCAIARNIETCAQCHEYACEELEAFFVKDPAARERLNQIKLHGHA